MENHGISHAGEFSLTELVQAVNDRLERAGHAADDGRVAERLDERTVRYYATKGLLPKPLRYDGRQAVYGYRHLLHLLAIKGQQARGWSLRRIQAWLQDSGLDDLERSLVPGGQGRPERVAARQIQVTYAPPRPAAPASRQAAAELRVFRLTPGVELIVDPSLVSQPERLARRLVDLLQALGSHDPHQSG